MVDHSEAPPVADHRRRTLAPAPARSLLLPQHQHEYTTPHHSPLHLNARTTAVCIDRRNMSWLVVVASDPAGPPSYPKAKAAQKKPTVPLPRGSPGGHVNARRATSPSVTSARPSSGLDTRRSAAGPRVATRRGEARPLHTPTAPITNGWLYESPPGPAVVFRAPAVPASLHWGIGSHRIWRCVRREPSVRLDTGGLLG